MGEEREYSIKDQLGTLESRRNAKSIEEHECQSKLLPFPNPPIEDHPQVHHTLLSRSLFTFHLTSHISQLILYMLIYTYCYAHTTHKYLHGLLLSLCPKSSCPLAYITFIALFAIIVSTLKGKPQSNNRTDLNSDPLPGSLSGVKNLHGVVVHC